MAALLSLAVSYGHAIASLRTLSEMSMTQPPDPRTRTTPFRPLTFSITLLFGFFGLIPALVGRSNARQKSRDDRGYLKTFWLTFVPVFIAYSALVAVVILAGGSVTKNGPTPTVGALGPPSSNQSSVPIPVANDPNNAEAPERSDLSGWVAYLENTYSEILRSGDTSALDQYFLTPDAVYITDIGEVPGQRQSAYTIAQSNMNPNDARITADEIEISSDDSSGTPMQFTAHFNDHYSGLADIHSFTNLYVWSPTVNGYRVSVRHLNT